MSTPVIAFFNNKGGVGKTSLVYHLSWMFADRGMRVVAADLDPQANLTAAFISDEDQLEQLWPNDAHRRTIFGCLEPLKKGKGDIADPQLELINERLALIPGDMALSTFEDQLSETWPKCMDGDERSFRVTSAFWRILQRGAQAHKAEVILLDLGPNLGAINRSALIASDYVVTPLAPDLFSVQGMKNLGPVLRQWRSEWTDRIERNPARDIDLPVGRIQPLGYVILQHSVRLDRPVKAYDRWINRIPGVYSQSVLGQCNADPVAVATDPNCIAQLKHYRSLMPMAQEARKPMFFLKPADGALGSHTDAVKSAYDDFLALAKKIAQRTGIHVE